MSKLGQIFRLRFGAKSLIAIGAIGAAAGLVLIANGLYAVQRMNAGELRLARPYGLVVVAALGGFFLLSGIARIWTGLRAKKKRWFDDPLEKDD